MRPNVIRQPPRGLESFLALFAGVLFLRLRRDDARFVLTPHVRAQGTLVVRTPAALVALERFQSSVPLFMLLRRRCFYDTW